VLVLPTAAALLPGSRGASQCRGSGGASETKLQTGKTKRMRRRRRFIRAPAHQPGRMGC